MRPGLGEDPNEVEELEIPYDHPDASTPLPMQDVVVDTPPPLSRGLNGQSPLATLAQRYDHHFGNELFGSGYSGSAKFDFNSLDRRMTVEAEAASYATVFAYKQSVARFVLTGGASCTTSQPAAASVNAKTFILGSLVRDQSWDRTTSKSRVYSVSRNFFSAKRTFMVGPVPLGVTATITGEAGLDLGVSLTCPAGVKLEATPYTKLHVDASAGVNVVVASFGVQGSLNLINVSLPRTAAFEWDAARNCPKAMFSVNRTITTLDGTMGLFAQVKVLFFKKRWDVTLARWNGMRWNDSIVNWNRLLC